MYVRLSIGDKAVIEDVEEYIKKLPLEVNEVKFILSLPFLTAAVLKRLFQALPEHVYTIDLSRNNLVSVPTEELVEAFGSIPGHIGQLQLRGNLLANVFLVKKYKFDLPRVLTALPPHIIAVDLSDNELGATNKTLGVTEAMAAINLKDTLQALKFVKALQLSHNFFMASMLDIDAHLQSLSPELLILDLTRSIKCTSYPKVLENLPIHIITVCSEQATWSREQGGFTNKAALANYNAFELFQKIEVRVSFEHQAKRAAKSIISFWQEKSKRDVQLEKLEINESLVPR